MKVKLNDWLTPERLAIVSAWARRGLSSEQIASNLGVSRRTLYNWMQKSAELKSAVMQSRDIANCEIENALFQNALSGNTVAQIFWLKNKMPDTWRDKPVESINYDDTDKEDELSKSLRLIAENLKND